MASEHLTDYILNHLALISDHPSEEPQCPICYETWATNNLPIVRTHCNHAFHRLCVLTWFHDVNNTTCPACRSACFPKLAGILPGWTDIEEMPLNLRIVGLEHGGHFRDIHRVMRPYFLNSYAEETWGINYNNVLQGLARFTSALDRLDSLFLQKFHTVPLSMGDIQELPGMPAMSRKFIKWVVMMLFLYYTCNYMLIPELNHFLPRYRTRTLRLPLENRSERASCHRETIWYMSSYFACRMQIQYRMDLKYYWPIDQLTDIEIHILYPSWRPGDTARQYIDDVHRGAVVDWTQNAGGMAHSIDIGEMRPSRIISITPWFGDDIIVVELAGGFLMVAQLFFKDAYYKENERERPTELPWQLLPPNMDDFVIPPHLEGKMPEAALDPANQRLDYYF